MAERVLLVGCVKGKRAGAWPARDLYTSALFVRRRRYAEEVGDRWFILSALHGLLDPTARIERYDATLKEMRARQRRGWADQVLNQLDAVVPAAAGTIFEIHAGKEYRDFGLARGLAARGGIIEVPTGHLGIGQQLAWYDQNGQPGK